MVSVRPVAPSHFEQLYPLLRWHDPVLDKSVWQRIFSYSWQHDNPYCGYGLFEGNEAVGFIGLIFCDRPLPHHPTGPTLAKFCNLTTWVVKPPYRSHSLSLMMPIMRLKNCIITDLSASDSVIKISQRLGFQVLDDAVKVLLPRRLSAQLPSQTPGEKKAETKVKTVASKYPPIFVGADIASRSLPPAEQTIFNDHRHYPNCHQLVLQAGTDYCHVVYTLNRETELSYSHIQSISNLPLFEQHQMPIRQQIVHQSGLPLIVIDARLVASIALPFSYRLPLSSSRIYRAPSEAATQIAPSQIDNLYSELMLLEFGTADALTLGWREKALSLCSPALQKLGHLHPSTP